MKERGGGNKTLDQLRGGGWKRLRARGRNRSAPRKDRLLMFSKKGVEKGDCTGGTVLGVAARGGGAKVTSNRNRPLFRKMGTIFGIRPVGTILAPVRSLDVESVGGWEARYRGTKCPQVQYVRGWLSKREFCR